MGATLLCPPPVALVILIFINQLSKVYTYALHISFSKHLQDLHGPPLIPSDFRGKGFYRAYYQAFLRDGLNVLIGLNSRKLPQHVSILRIVYNRGGGRSIIGEGGIFIYSCSAQLISFEIDCFYSL